MRQVPPLPGSKPDDNRKDKDAIREKQGEDDPMKGKSDIVSEVGLSNLERDILSTISRRQKVEERMRHKR